jgi:hypothetical protein
MRLAIQSRTKKSGHPLSISLLDYEAVNRSLGF